MINEIKAPFLVIAYTEMVFKNQLNRCTAKICQFVKPTFDQKLEHFFKTKKPKRKIFTFEGCKIGVIYNPTLRALRVGPKPGLGVESQGILLLSNGVIPPNFIEKIEKKTQEGLRYGMITSSSINRRPFSDFVRF